MITFEDHRIPAAKSDRPCTEESDVQQLTDELKVTREELQSTIEQLEISNDQLKVSNEEVTAANEELQSANEELETSKEELQSVNEELNTINARLQEKVEELESTNNDLINLLSSTNIATVFLDKGLRIKRYTPAITRLLSLIPSDVGRPVADVLRRFSDNALLDDAVRVLADLTPIAKEVPSDDGRWFIRRITPYRTQDDRIEGVVVTFMDVTDLKETEDALRTALTTAEEGRSTLEALMEHVPEGITIADAPDVRIRMVSRAGRELTGKQRELIEGIPFVEHTEKWDLYCSDGVTPAINEDLPLTRAVQKGETVSDEEWVLGTPDGRRIRILCNAGPIRDKAGEITGGVIAWRDITARKQAEEALHQAHLGSERHLAQLQAVLEHLTEGLVVSDLEGNLYHWNRAALDMHGFASMDECRKNLSQLTEIFELSTPEGEILPLDQWPLARILRGETLREWEVCVRRLSNNRERVFLYGGTLARDASGNPMLAVVSVTDITDRKEAEGKFLETHRRLKALMKALPVGVSFSDDATCQRITGNPTVLAQFEVRPEDNLSASAPDDSAPGRKVRFFLEGRPIGDTELPLQRAVAENRTIQPMELDVELPSGRRWFAEASGAPIRDAQGKVVGGVAVTLDITHRKEMEEDLRRSRDELELRVRERTDELVKINGMLKEHAALLDLVHDAILVRGMDGRVVYWSRGAESLYGWKQDEALGKITQILLHTRFPKPLEDIVADLLAGGQWEGELHHVTQSGKAIVVESRWAVRRNAEGPPTGFLEINHDISERKEAEAQVRSYMAKLEESNQALQDFASIASHDMQEPLRKVISFGNMLKQKYGESLGNDGKDYLERMLAATNRMQTLLNSLLDYARVTSRAEPFRKIELAAIVRDVLSDLEIRIEKTGADVDLGDLPAVEADPTQMRQLFQNLIGNALKFHKKGEPPIITVRGIADGEGILQILVEDNGIGFQEKHMDRIFAPFQRLHGRSEYEGGTGMGLAICKKIVERHGGAITARSTPGEGSTFVITLPVKHLTGT